MLADFHKVNIKIYLHIPAGIFPGLMKTLADFFLHTFIRIFTGIPYHHKAAAVNVEKGKLRIIFFQIISNKAKTVINTRTRVNFPHIIVIVDLNSQNKRLHSAQFFQKQRHCFKAEGLGSVFKINRRIFKGQIHYDDCEQTEKIHNKKTRE